MRQSDKTVRGILINPFEGTAGVMDADLSSLPRIHALLDCDCFGIIGRPLLGKKKRWLSVWYDDEGLLRGEERMLPAIVCLRSDLQEPCEVIYGITFICDSNQDGEPMSLSASTCDELMSQIKKTIGNDGKERFSLVYEV